MANVGEWDRGPLMAERDRPRGDRPRGDRPHGDRPRGDRPHGDRPRGDNPRGAANQPGGGGRGSGSYPGKGFRPTNREDRPHHEYADKPRAEHSDRPRGEYSGRQRGDYSDRPGPDYSDRPRREYAKRPRRDFGDRPPFDDRSKFDRPRTNRPYPGSPRPAFATRRAWPPTQPYEQKRPSHPPRVERQRYIEEGEELICGRRPVEEAFAARRDAMRLLIVPERRAALDALAIHATTLRIPVVEVEGGTLTALAGFDGHQGVALVARPRPAGDVAAILARARQRHEAPFVLVLDSLEDPQNFGTLLRSAEAAGVHGVIYPTRRSAPLSPAAIKASAGATEHLILAAVDDLAGTLADLHADGLRIAGADEEAALAFTDADLRGPLAIVVGSEGRGISGPVRRRVDLVLRIPMRGQIESLNAAVAGSILLFAAAGQRPEPRREVGESVASVESGAGARSESPATESVIAEEDLLPDDR